METFIDHVEGDFYKLGLLIGGVLTEVTLEKSELRAHLQKIDNAIL